MHLVNVDKRLGRRRMARIKRAGMLPELPPALPIALILAIFILLLTFVFKFIPETEIVGAMAFSILTVFVILYTITKLIKGIK